MIQMKTVPGRGASRSTPRHLQLNLDRAVDEALTDSFPASDPPPWNPGGAACAARPPPVCASRDVVILTGDRRTVRQWVGTAAGAIGVTLLIPAAILIIGMPIALAVRGVIDAATWLRVLVGN
jgi:hypothetical protein